MHRVERSTVVMYRCRDELRTHSNEDDFYRIAVVVLFIIVLVVAIVGFVGVLYHV